jgi:hypothetical protein
MPHMPSNYILSKAHLGENHSCSSSLKYLIFTMQNSSCGSDFLWLPWSTTGVIDGSRRYFSWPSLLVPVLPFINSPNLRLTVSQIHMQHIHIHVLVVGW